MHEWSDSSFETPTKPISGQITEQKPANDCCSSRFGSGCSSEEQLEKNISKDRYRDEWSEMPTISQLIDAPREIPTKAYSLAPDIATGWKPKRKNQLNFQNVFPINFNNSVVDHILRHIVRKKNSQYGITYLGPRKQNSYQLHENQTYPNPYPIDKKVDCCLPERPGVNKSVKLVKTHLIFNSQFESGNLDAAIQVNESEFDLFMRVDSNTKGHTNWFYFQVQNCDWVGCVKFNICNFRRQQSLYQRGIKPYVLSEKQDRSWAQKGFNISYQRKPLRYKFLYNEEQSFESLCTYFTLSFTYNFDTVNDTVKFAYCVPYTYSDLLGLIGKIKALPIVKYESIWRTLSGIAVPAIQITDFSEPNYRKKVILVTARIHPGESNSSHVCEGLIRQLCFAENSLDFLKKIHFYIIPMLNPDGVIAGNYRTSLFGRDLNRTFKQSRKYAFPETYYLLQYGRDLKKEHKQRFTTYLDLHGHSVKKNIFFYGPDYQLAHNFYSQCREYARILGNLTTMFRYYSCIFRISSQKATTARATFNRAINVPFTYTIESSNGAYFDSIEHQQQCFSQRKWLEMGEFLIKGLEVWIDRQVRNIQTRRTKFFDESFQLGENQEPAHPGSADRGYLASQDPPGKQKQSDDDISEGGSDSEPSDQDFADEQLNQLEFQIIGKEKRDEKMPVVSEVSPQKSQRLKIRNQSSDRIKQLKKMHRCSNKRAIPAKSQRLPPIHLQENPVQLLPRFSNRKRLVISQAFKNVSVTDIKTGDTADVETRSRRIISHQLAYANDKRLRAENNLICFKSRSNRQELPQSLRKNW